jgi:hypothetical protein
VVKQALSDSHPPDPRPLTAKNYTAILKRIKMIGSAVRLENPPTVAGAPRRQGQFRAPGRSERRPAARLEWQIDA